MVSEYFVRSFFVQRADIKSFLGDVKYLMTSFPVWTIGAKTHRLIPGFMGLVLTAFS